MLSILGRIGHLLGHSGFLSGLLQRLIENALKKALLIIHFPGLRLSPILVRDGSLFRVEPST